MKNYIMSIGHPVIITGTILTQIDVNIIIKALGLIAQIIALIPMLKKKKN